MGIINGSNKPIPLNNLRPNNTLLLWVWGKNKATLNITHYTQQAIPKGKT
jgi:hypothetical protein